MQKRVLLAGEDQESRRAFAKARPLDAADWEFHFVPAFAEALEALKKTDYTAVVAHERIERGTPAMAFLNTVLQIRPRCLRFVCVQPDEAQAWRCLGTVHRLLFHPLDLTGVREAVANALALEAWLPGEKTSDLLATLQRVPSPPTLYFKLVRLLESPTASLDEIAEMIAHDPGITAKLLQLVNSAVFGLHLPVSDPAAAVGFLGMRPIRSLVLLAHTFSNFDHLSNLGFSIDDLWKHAYDVGGLARQIAQSAGADQDCADQAFTGGLLHDFGKLILAANHSVAFRQAAERSAREGIQLWQAEMAVLGTHHAEIGACLLSIWGLPSPIIEAVGLHHCPARFSSAGCTPLVAVHVANCLARAIGPATNQSPRPALDMAFLAHMGVVDQVEEWTELGDECCGPAVSSQGL